MQFLLHLVGAAVKIQTKYVQMFTSVITETYARVNGVIAVVGYIAYNLQLTCK